jgi:hypothetical protein
MYSLTHPQGFVTVEIKKPIYANYVGVREKYIWQAKREHKDLRITTPNGTTIISPTKYLQGADRIEKEFLIPGKPMVLYCKNLKVGKPKEETPKPDFSPVYDISPTFSTLEEIKRRNPDLMKKLGR